MMFLNPVETCWEEASLRRESTEYTDEAIDTESQKQDKVPILQIFFFIFGHRRLLGN